VVSTIERLQSAVGDASTRYTRLVLLGGHADAEKSESLHQLGTASGSPVVNLGLELARSLLDVPTRQRSVAAADRAADLARPSDGSSLTILDHLELLFLPELRLDPLKLLQDSARNGVVVANWPGSTDGDELLYGSPSHPEFRRYSAADCILVEVSPHSRGSA
jgi:hypothetical protein